MHQRTNKNKLLIILKKYVQHHKKVKFIFLNTSLKIFK